MYFHLLYFFLDLDAVEKCRKSDIKTKKFHTIFHLKEQEELFPLTNTMELHFIEMPKLIQDWKERKLEVRAEMEARNQEALAKAKAEAEATKQKAVQQMNEQFALKLLERGTNTETTSELTGLPLQAVEALNRKRS